MELEIEVHNKSVYHACIKLWVWAGEVLSGQSAFSLLKNPHWFPVYIMQLTMTILPAAEDSIPSSSPCTHLHTYGSESHKHTQKCKIKKNRILEM